MKTEQPAGPVRLSVNTVVEGRWFAAGAELPFRASGDVPEPLRPFIAVDEPEEPPGPASLNFQPNRIYAVDPEGAILSRQGRREAAQLAGEAAWQAQAEAEAEAVDEQTAAAMKIAQEEHEFRISGDILSAQIKDRDAGAAVTAAQQKADAEEKPAVLYVRRGGAWMHADRAKLRPGEPVFLKEPSGAWAAVGTVNSTGGLPLPPEIL